jgi:hypothetical protein
MTRAYIWELCPPTVSAVLTAYLSAATAVQLAERICSCSQYVRNIRIGLGQWAVIGNTESSSYARLD